jgi:peptidyl-prolyl cis-trans isomerase B (cyclophilin B)
MNRNYILGAVGIIAIIVLVIFAIRNSKRLLPNGNVNQQTETPTVSVSQTPITGNPRVTLKTSKGDIILELRPDVAPKTVANFLNKFTNGYCEGKTFHRVEDWVIQGCDPLGTGTGGNDTLPTETSTEPFTAGALGVARKANPKEISNDSQFFIVKKDAFYLNGEYTYFGKVVSGMDVVNKIAIGDKIISSTVLSK